MANQYTKITRENIIRKVNRKRNPVSTMVGLANEFGVNTEYTRSSGGAGSAAPGAFRNKVKTLVGSKQYSNLFTR